MMLLAANHWSCTTVFHAMWWLDMKVPSDNRQAPTASSPYASCPAHAPTEMLWVADPRMALCPAAACLCCQSWNDFQKSSSRGLLWVRLKAARSTLLLCLYRKKDLCSGLYGWHGEHCHPRQHACHRQGPVPVTWPCKKTRAAQRAKGRGLVTR